MAVPDLKAALRSEIKLALHRVPPEQRAAASAVLCERLKSRPVWQGASAVLFYAARPDEIDLEPLIAEAFAANKRVLLPRYRRDLEAYEAAQVQDLERDLAPGKFGIREPGANCPGFPLNRLDLALVPGVCFDLTGRRLGRGRGFYDRLLPSVGGIRCGVGMDLQVRAEIPAEPHDNVLDCILTPTRWISLNQRVV